MSLENISDFVRGLAQEDDTLTDKDDCRNSILKIKARVNERFPRVETVFLVHPEAREGFGVHYSLLVKQGQRKTLLNLVKAPGFPIYVGDLGKAPPTFSAMKETPKVI
jgi:hypothetical protein